VFLITAAVTAAPEIRVWLGLGVRVPKAYPEGQDIIYYTTIRPNSKVDT